MHRPSARASSLSSRYFRSSDCGSLARDGMSSVPLTTGVFFSRVNARILFFFFFFKFLLRLNRAMRNLFPARESKSARTPTFSMKLLRDLVKESTEKDARVSSE